MKLIALPKLLTVLFCSVVFSTSSFSQVNIINYGSTWKYLDNNTRPVDWETTDFDDVLWSSGLGELGYGDGDEATTVSFGPDANNKYTTTYFRKAINIPNLASYSGLTFNVERDDSYVVYVNGVEVGRNNLAAGPITHATFASAVVEDATISFTVPASAFSPTYNVIAVEIHQVNLAGSDLSFDLELVANTAAGPGAVLINNNSSWRYLDTDTRPANWQTSAFADGLWKIGYGELGFGEGDETTIINGGPVGARFITTYFRKTFTVADSAAYPSYSFNVKRDDGFVLYLNGIEIGRNNMPASAPAHGTFSTANVEEEVITVNIAATLLRNGSNVLAAEIHQSNVSSTDLSFDLKLTGISGQQKLLTFGSSWNFLDINSRPAGWETVGFDDSGWGSGGGELGFGDADESTIVASGPGGGRFITTYFRKIVNVVNPNEYLDYTFSLERDDGYVLYINGAEVSRNNMPAGAPAHGTLATLNIEDSIIVFTLPNTSLVAGNNVIAVEVHQNNASSSDLSFDMEIVGNTSQQVLIDKNSSWRYFDGNAEQANWRTTNFADGLWKKGYGQLGYGDGDENTIISFGPDANNKYRTAYFRKIIYVENAASFLDYTFSVRRDDGFVVWVNGTEMGRNNMPGGTPVFGTQATTGVDDSTISFTIPASAFVNGKNAIAVEMHQNSGTSTDVSFDLQLFGNYSQLAFIPFNALWKYLDTDTRPANWETSLFNDASWATGYAELGYGDGGEATIISYGPDINNKYVTSYFRKTVNIADASSYSGFVINIIRDDGAVIYVNGVEVVRSNMPVPPVTHTTLATANVSGAEESAVNSFTIPASYFVNGNNVIAVEIHQDLVTSSDLSFNLELTSSDAAPVSPAIINFTDVWKFLDDGSDQGTAWKAPAFNDAAWNSGPAKLGFGNDLETTVISGGPVDNRYRTTYFRKTFNITNLAQYQSMVLNLMRDDGAIIYVNGTEVIRENMPAGVIDYQTFASNTIEEGTQEETAVSFTIPTTSFVEGSNIIAVEMHQINATSSDLGFSLELLGSQQPGGSGTLTRGPYLQMGSETSIAIRWKTNVATNSRVEIGTVFGTYPTVVDSAASTTEHIVFVSGLTPDTKYFYRVGSTTQLMQGATDNFFVTVPPANTTRKLRIAAFGDCGRNDNNFQTNTLTQYRNYLSANGIEAADAWLLLGDNAYNNGTETEFNNNFFSAYNSTILKNHKLYPAPGNHDYGATPNAVDTKIMPYYDLFTMPKNGELGGVASGTEAFYSYNIGDIHFLSLDSYGEENDKKMYDTTGAQVAWIKADLAANTRKWVIAYWHHPPYTMGSHNSNSEGDLVSIREDFIRILERNGVDLIICGHSHDYERSYLLKGYYKANPGDPQVNENNFNVNLHTASSSSAKYDGTANSCPYTYKYAKNNHGTVYIVAGSAGADGGVQSGYPHNALPFAQDDGGMFFFEVDSNRLDAKFIRRDGQIADNFTIMHDVNTADTFFIISGNQVSLDASWKGNYAWSNAATTRTITVTPPEGITNYSVVDNLGCLKDSFAVYANICAGNINTWVGNVSSAWENAANWSCGIVPDINSEVMINPGTPFSAVVNSDVVIKNITIKTGASVTVLTGFKLDVKEPLRP